MEPLAKVKLEIGDTMKHLLVALSIALTGCTTVRESYPSRTATEQLIISEAADNAAKDFKLNIAKERTCYLDATNFEGVDAKYAVSAIRQKLMEQGIALLDKRDDADTIIEIRAGALSMDSRSKTLNLPGINVGSVIPIIPSPLNFNQLSRKVDEGMAKISGFAYDKKTGHLLSVAETVVGRSKRGRLNGQNIIVVRPN